MPTIDELLERMDKRMGDKFAEYITQNMSKDLSKLGWAKEYKEEYEREHGREYTKNAPLQPGRLPLECVLALATLAGINQFGQEHYDSIKDITLDDLERTEFPKIEKEYIDLMKIGDAALDKVGGSKIVEIVMKYHMCKNILEGYNIYKAILEEF